MAGVIGSALLQHSLRLGEALSGVFGSVSLTAWICLLLPQLITNYKAKSADALSMKFLIIWLVGDITNLLGALCTNLAPTAIALSVYFCCADVILIAQCTYYNTLNARRRGRADRRRLSGATAETDETAVADPAEDEPLLDAQRQESNRRRRADSTGLPGSHRRHSVRRAESNLDPLTRIVTGEDDTPDSNPWLHNTLSVAAVWIVGAAGWFVSYKMGGWSGDEISGGDGVPGAARSDELATIGMILGYASAALYLCARIPQIIKNWREKSTEGLAILFFLLSLTGNFTYGSSLLVYAETPEDMLKTIPWLLGSLGTMVEDCVIFVQFRLYSPKRQLAKMTTDAA